MTLALIVNDEEIEGVEGATYKVGPYCANPACPRPVDHQHHMLRRSKHGKPYNWIRLPDGNVRGNLTGLCWRCHENITGPTGGHKAAIRYVDGSFLWCDVSGPVHALVYTPIAPIAPQPPTPDSIAATASSNESESEPCPTCGQRRRHSSVTAPSGERRRRKTWVMDVPDDHEDGAEILDALSDDLAIKLGYMNENSRLRRFHSVFHALVFTQQHMSQFRQSLAGRG